MRYKYVRAFCIRRYIFLDLETLVFSSNRIKGNRMGYSLIQT
jgi:hypothetical protein